jgi:hypothetical protein
MKYININPLSHLYSELIKEGIQQGYTVVTTQRPLNGLKSWEDESIGYGRWFAYGSLEQYKENWEFLDARIVKLITNEDIESIIKEECIKEGIDIQEVLEDCTISELAEQFNLCYID